MLEFFRRHRGAFLITLTVIIILSFSVWGGWRGSSGFEQRQAQPSDVAITMFGEDHTVADVLRADRSLRFAMQHMQNYELLSSLMMISGGRSFGGGDQVSALLLARHLMEKMGVHVSDAEAQAALEQLPALQTNGKFDRSRGQMLEEMAGSMGFDSKELLLGIMKDTLGLKKLQEVVAGGYSASPIAAEKQYASHFQTFTGAKIVFETETFKKTAKISDEEIKKYYEENKENYKTPEKRAVSYVLFENPRDLEKKPLEERMKAQNAQVERVNAFNKLANKDGKDFAAAAAEAKEKVVTVPAFTQAEPPAALKGEGSLLEMIFAGGEGTRAEPVEGSAGWYVYDVTKVEAPRQQTLAEAREKIKDTLLDQKAAELRSKAVNEARLALIEGLKAGKKIEDLAKEKKLTLESLPSIDAANPPTEVPNGYLIAQQAAKTAVGGVSAAIDYDKGTLLVYVRAKELRKRSDSAEQRKNQELSLSQQESNSIFQTWFKKQTDAAKIVNKFGPA